MSNLYIPLAHNDEEENPLQHSNSRSADTISVDRRIMGLLLILTILNMIVAVTHGYYSLRITKLLQEYDEKPLSSLPRIDPLNGQYRTPPLAGN
jgi:hypothetical protein